MKHIFGFCEDYDKILYGMKQTLTFTRNNDNDAIFRANTAANGKITLDRISWYMPHVIPGDKDKMELYKISKSKETIPVGYRMIQCSDYSRPRKRPGRHEKGAGRKKRFKSLPNGKIVDWSRFLSLIGWKTLCENEKMLVTSIFSFSHIVPTLFPKGFFLTVVQS